MKSLAALRLSFTWLLGFLMFYYSMILTSNLTIFLSFFFRLEHNSDRLVERGGRLNGRTDKRN